MVEGGVINLRDAGEKVGTQMGDGLGVMHLLDIEELSFIVATQVCYTQCESMIFGQFDCLITLHHQRSRKMIYEVVG